MVIHTKEKTKLHVKTAQETKIKAGNVLTVERTPKFAGAEREAKSLICLAVQVVLYCAA